MEVAPLFKLVRGINACGPMQSKEYNACGNKPELHTKLNKDTGRGKPFTNASPVLPVLLVVINGNSNG